MVWFNFKFFVCFIYNEEYINIWLFFKKVYCKKEREEKKIYILCSIFKYVFWFLINVIELEKKY